MAQTPSETWAHVHADDGATWVHPGGQACSKLTARAEAAEPMLKWFAFDHLPEHLQVVSEPFHDLAHHLVQTVPRSPERTVALRKLLEGKDAAVRAQLV